VTVVRIGVSDESKDQSWPRFEFGNNLDPRGEKTATIKDLLAEMNSERNHAEGSSYDIKSLGTVLRFLSSITGQRYRSIVQELPLSTIKTIKLLHKRSRYIDAHLMRLIEPPGDKSSGLLDFLATPASEEGEDVKKLIKAMIGELSREVDPIELSLINALSDPEQLREKFRRDTNSAIDGILLAHIHIDSDLLIKSDAYQIEKTRQFMAGMSPLQRESRADVATLVYLSILDYVHRLHFDASTQLSIPDDIEIPNIEIDVGNLCLSASRQTGKKIEIDTNFLSLHEMWDFCLEHTSDLVAAIKQATGFDYDNRALRKDMMRACLVMYMYLSHAEIPTDAETKPIGIAHLVASFASILHQRSSKAAFVKKSVKYTSSVADPQRQLDLFLSKKSRHIPLTTQYIYSERMKSHLHVLLNRKGIYDSYRALQLAQTELTRDVFLSLDPTRIHELIVSYRDYMLSAATEFIAAHGLQNIRYEWEKLYRTGSA